MTQNANATQWLKDAAIHHKEGRLREAIACYQEALRINPNSPSTQCNMGIAFIALKKLDEAATAFRAAIALKPDFAEAYNNLGGALRMKGLLDEALAAYEMTTRIAPNYAEGHSNLGRAFADKGRYDEAIAQQKLAISLAPNDAPAYYSLGNALSLSGQHEAAIESYRKLLSIKPNFPGGHNYLGLSLRNLNRIDEALAAHRTAMTLYPDDAEAHINYALTLLVSGDFVRGWREYEWRAHCTTFPCPYQKRAQPQWNGGFLEGKTLLIHPEQGLGDTIQFIRYLPMAATYGGRIVVECQPPLLRLAKKIPGASQWVSRGVESVPAFDLHCPMLSLPNVLWTTLERVPNEVPYLSPDKEWVDQWAQRLGPRKKPLRVGLVWRGSPGHKNDRNRSLGEGALASLENDAIEFVSLQKSDPDKPPPPSPGLALTDVTSGITDFADTAAIIANLDLVLSVDTSVAHLAGAMGARVWTLLPFSPDWRWILNRDDTPWYPTMQLFRQKKIGDWAEVIGRVRTALGELRDVRSR